MLPSIRKHGAYMTDKVIERTLSDLDYLISLATRLKKEKAKRELVDSENIKNKSKVLSAINTFLGSLVKISQNQ